MPHRYLLEDTDEKMYMLAAQLKKQPRFCFDTETTGTDERTAELVGLAFSWKAHEGYYVPVPEDRAEAQRIVDIFKPVLENEAIGKVAQNAKYDIRVLAKYAVEVKGPLFDTMVAHYLLKPDQQKHGMDYLSEVYLGYRPVSIETLIGPKERGKTQKSMRDADLNAVKEYSAEDADITWQLSEKFAPLLEADEVTALFNEVEMPLVHVLADMETEGIRIDIPGRTIEALVSEGLDPVVLLGDPAPWAGRGHRILAMAAWSDFVRAAVARYGWGLGGRESVRNWQFENEPNLPISPYYGDPGGYAALLQRMMTEVHAVDATARVWGPSVVWLAGNDGYGTNGTGAQAQAVQRPIWPCLSGCPFASSTDR